MCTQRATDTCSQRLALPSGYTLPSLSLSLSLSLRDTFSTVLRSGFHLRRPGPESTRGMELAGTPPQHGSGHVRKADTRNSVTCLSQPSSYHRSVFSYYFLDPPYRRGIVVPISYRYLGINRVRERRLLPFVVRSSCVDRGWGRDSEGRFDEYSKVSRGGKWKSLI